MEDTGGSVNVRYVSVVEPARRRLTDYTGEELPEAWQVTGARIRGQCSLFGPYS